MQKVRSFQEFLYFLLFASKYLFEFQTVYIMYRLIVYILLYIVRKVTNITSTKYRYIAKSDKGDFPVKQIIYRVVRLK